MSAKDESAGNEDLKAKMREALDRKKGNDRASPTPPAPRRRRTAPRSSTAPRRCTAARPAAGVREVSHALPVPARPGAVRHDGPSHV